MQKKPYQRLKNGQLLSQPRDPLTGRRIRITAGTLAELEHRTRKVAQVREGLRWGELNPRTAANVLNPATGKRLTVGECWSRYYPGVPVRSKPIARSTWGRRLEPYFADAMVWELTKATMAAWAAKLEAERFAPKTIRSAYDWLAGAISLAVDDGVLDGWPWGNWRPKRPTPIHERGSCKSVDELAQLLATCRDLDARDWQAGRYAARTATVAVLALCGLRQGEACGLAWSAVDLQAQVMAVRFQAARGWPERWPEGRPKDPTKTKPRSIHLHPDAIAALEMQRRQVETWGWYDDEGAVFPNWRGGFRTCGRVIKPEALRDLVAAAGLPNPAQWVTHSLRHTFAQLETSYSGDPRAAQSRTGHASIAQLEVYLRSAGRGLTRSAIPRLPGAGVLDSPIILEPQADPPALPAVSVAAEHAVCSEDETQLSPTPPPEPPTVELRLSRVIRGADAARHDAELAREAGRQAARREADRPFEDLARDWLEAGRQPEPRPAAVTRAVRMAYVRAYKAKLAAATGERWEALSLEARELIAERDPEHALRLQADLDQRREAARASGRRARKASLGAWGQAIKRAERARAREAAEAGQALTR